MPQRCLLRGSSARVSLRGWRAGGHCLRCSRTWLFHVARPQLLRRGQGSRAARRGGVAAKRQGGVAGAAGRLLVLLIRRRRRHLCRLGAEVRGAGGGRSVSLGASGDTGTGQRAVWARAWDQIYRSSSNHGGTGGSLSPQNSGISCVGHHSTPRSRARPLEARTFGSLAVNCASGLSPKALRLSSRVISITSPRLPNTHIPVTLAHRTTEAGSGARTHSVLTRC